MNTENKTALVRFFLVLLDLVLSIGKKHADKHLEN